MDIVWDKGGLIAISDPDAPRQDTDEISLANELQMYVALLKSLLAPNFSYGLSVPDYDADGYTGELDDVTG
ncbi:unnamed protein product [Ixodes hexagonus]